MAERSPEEILDAKRVAAWKDMVNTEGWKLFVQLLEIRMADIGAEVLMPMDNILAAPRFEYKKGTLNGLQLAYDVVPALLQAHSQNAANSDADDNTGDE